MACTRDYCDEHDYDARWPWCAAASRPSRDREGRDDDDGLREELRELIRELRSRRTAGARR